MPEQVRVESIKTEKEYLSILEFPEITELRSGTEGNRRSYDKSGVDNLFDYTDLTLTEDGEHLFEVANKKIFKQLAAKGFEYAGEANENDWLDLDWKEIGKTLSDKICSPIGFVVWHFNFNGVDLKEVE